MGKPRIGDIEAEIIRAIRTADDLYYVPDEQVQGAEQGIDFAQGLINLNFGVLVQYAGGAYTPRNTDSSAYSIDERWTLIAVAGNLRGPAVAKVGIAGEPGVYDILEDLKTAIVKARKMTIDSGKTVYLELIGTAVVEDLFYQFGAAAIGLQIKARCASWEYAT